MNWPHLHLMVNHFPVILAVVAAAASLLGVVVRRRGVWVFAAVCLTLAGASAVPAFLSGHEAADAIEDMPRPPKQVIHAHEEAGETAAFILIGAGLVAAFVWWRLSKARAEEVTPRAWMRGAVLVAALAGAGAAGYAALLGGRIYHGRNGNARPAAWDSVGVER
jgi:uncharacterized membrane protein